jgi:hypothetical protein
MPKVWPDSKICKFCPEKCSVNPPLSAAKICKFLAKQMVGNVGNIPIHGIMEGRMSAPRFGPGLTCTHIGNFTLLSDAS